MPSVGHGPGRFYFNAQHLSKGNLKLCTMFLFWVLFVTCSILPALNFFSTRGFIRSLLCSLSFCCPDEVCCPRILFYTGGFTKMHFQLQLVLGVEKSLIKRQWAGVLLCELWAKWGSTFYSCLAFQCSQWKIK